MNRDKDYVKLINSNKWRILRHKKLSRQPLCELCQANNIITPAIEVHHIIPVENAINYHDKRILMYDYSNLQSLCHNCHVMVHNDMGHGGTPEGVRRKNNAKLNYFKEKYLD